MRSKEYYQAVVRIVEFLKESGENHLTVANTEELSGEYWPEISRMLGQLNIGFEIYGGEFLITQPELLRPLYAEALNVLEIYTKQEADRELDNKFKTENIIYGRKGYNLSRIAIAISISALLIEIGQRIAGLL